VSCDPYRDFNLSYPQNSELKKRNKQYSVTTDRHKDFSYLKHSLKKMPSFIFAAVYLALVRVVQNLEKHGG